MANHPSRTLAALMRRLGLSGWDVGDWLVRLPGGLSAYVTADGKAELCAACERLGVALECHPIVEPETNG